MQGLRWLQMTREEIDDFLGEGGTGVLSFGSGADESPASGGGDVPGLLPRTRDADGPKGSRG
ncbi:hypothetical protein ACYJ1Y_15520 [Natrialbaceae archaeon A-gly3]